MDDKKYLRIAVDKAKESVKRGGFPAGAIVVKNDQIIAEGISIGTELNDPTSHAETASIRETCKQLQTTDLKESILYASLQPCLMCFSVANWAGISRIVYGCHKTDEMVNKSYYEGHTDIEEINKRNSRQIELVFISDLENEMLDLIKTWEENN